MRLLVAAATTLEIEPFLTFLEYNFEKDPATDIYTKGNLNIYICITGVGSLLTTFHLLEALAVFNPYFCLQVGVAGAFNRELALGEVVMVREDMLADLGVEDSDGFHDVFEIGLLAAGQKPFLRKKLVNTFQDFPMKLDKTLVSALTVNTVSGVVATIKTRAEHYSCDLESMEGAAFHYVCLAKGYPFLQVRAISNYVEPRNKESWKMHEAIANLNKWLTDHLPY